LNSLDTFTSLLIISRTIWNHRHWFGFPTTSPQPQARHWFAGALFDLELYHSERADVRLALALPKRFPTYHRLLARVDWLKAALPFTVFWVAETDEVNEE
jgi:hypothetical protein